MPAVESQMLELGTVAPAFELHDPDGVKHSLPNDAAAVLVMFISNHCPFVIHIRDELAKIGQDYGDRGVAIFAINSNDVVKFPADRPELMKQVATDVGFTFPYLFDETQEIAKAYRAACTPDFYVFDKDLKLAYRGQLDDSRPGNGKPVNGADLRAALDAVVASEKPSAVQHPSIGCSIKWQPGNAPPYS